MEYNAQMAPSSEEWLASEEGERLAHIIEYHEYMEAELPNLIYTRPFTPLWKTKSRREPGSIPERNRILV